MDTSKMCRSCMKEMNKSQWHTSEGKIKEMYHVCTGIKINSDLSLPQQFCSECIPKIESSYSFIKEAKRIEDILKSLVSLVNDSSSTKEQKLKLEESNFSNVLKVEFDPEHEMLQNKDDKYMNKYEIKVEEADEPMNEVNNEIFVDETQLKQKHLMENRNKNKTKQQLNKNKHKLTLTIVKTNKKELKKKPVMRKLIQPHVCELCDKKYMSKVTLQRHINTFHSTTRRCPVCDKDFEFVSSLKNHMMVHSNERPYSCEECGKTFKWKDQIRSHVKQVHESDRPFECDICHVRMKTKSNLEIHIKRHDVNAREYLCTVCGMSFSTKRVLQEHSYRHTGERPYKCKLCPYSSKASSTMLRHIRIHNGDRRLRCEAPGLYGCRSGINTYTRASVPSSAASAPTGSWTLGSASCTS